MRWFRDKKGKRGGYWKCLVGRREAVARYRKTEKGKAAQARHHKSEKYRVARERYRKSEKGRAAATRYDKSEKGLAKSARYRQKIGGLQLQTYRMNAWFKESQKRIARLEKELNG
jgi:hypothetical protein